MVCDLDWRSHQHLGGVFLPYRGPAPLHAMLIGLMAGFLGIVVFLIIANDRPFMGDTSISPGSYQLILDTLMNVK